MSGKRTSGREGQEGAGFLRAFHPCGEMSTRSYAIHGQFISILTGHTVDMMEWDKRSTRCLLQRDAVKKAISKMKTLIMKDLGHLQS